MKKITKIVLVLLAVPVFLFSFNIKPALAVTDNSALIAQLEQEIQSLIRQIIALLQQQIKSQIAANNAGIQNNIGTQMNTQSQVQNQNSNNSGPATLTVNATGVTAYVSINGGAQFAYTSPITLNNGDAYSVTASASGSGGNGNSTSKCSGVASSSGTYVCNISINSSNSSSSY